MGAGAVGDSEHRPLMRRHFEVFEMHMVIDALVEASTESEALAAGKPVFNRLVGVEPHSCAVLEESAKRWIVPADVHF